MVGRNVSLNTIQLVVAVVGGVFALVWVAIQIFDRFYPNPNGSFENGPSHLSVITEIMEELQVPKDESAFIGGLAERFLLASSNPPRKKVVKYVRFKKNAVVQARIIAREDEAAGDSHDINVEVALRQGDIESIESVICADDDSGEASRDGTKLLDEQLLLRAHLAIIIDEPQVARAYFERLAARLADPDPQSARYLLADAADNLSSLGCFLGKDWLNAAIVLYERSLQNWPRKEEPIEWAITQNNFGAALMSFGTYEADDRLKAKVLCRSTEAFSKAASVLSYDRELPDVKMSIVFGNWKQAASKLLAIDPDNHVLQQERAVAVRNVTFNESHALSSGGKTSVNRLREKSRSMQIESSREATKAQRLRLARGPNPCQRSM